MTEMIVAMIPVLPLVASLFAAIGNDRVSARVIQVVTIGAVALSTVFSLMLLSDQMIDPEPIRVELYRWARLGMIDIQITCLVDALSAVMISVVTVISLVVHIYSIGYMHDDPGKSRFFATISFFTFAMLMLVMADNFLQLFFGWEAVGLASYLLIGFWHTKPTATAANLKAFLVNRVGDFGFLLGIAAIYSVVGSFYYADLFAYAPVLSERTIELWSGMDVPASTLICLLLFMGAMGKSAQFPLHVWLPDSMEGPTPISALIHAATMVTAGIFMVARLSPLFEISMTARCFILAIGAITALLMGLVAMFENDIKRIVAYSTLSQLGYMVMGLAVSAYASSIFHLVTHAFFKALLFLAAGSVILAMHHEQNVQKMGGLWRKMPVTFVTAVVGAFALAGFPGTGGFFSKDQLILAISHSDLPGSLIAGVVAYLGVVITAAYSARFIYKVFLGNHAQAIDIHESERVITIPLVVLAIGSVVTGWLLYSPFNSSAFWQSAIVFHSAEESTGVFGFLSHAILYPWALLLMLLGGGVTLWILGREVGVSRLRLGWIQNAYGIDTFYRQRLVPVFMKIGEYCWQGDREFLDRHLVVGLARRIGQAGQLLRHIQTGWLTDYALWMLGGVVLIIALVWGSVS